MKPGNSPTVSPFVIDIPNDSREVISIGSTRVFEYWLSFSRMCLRSFNMMISFVVIEFVLLEDLFITNLVIYQYIPFFFLFSIPKITPINGKNQNFLIQCTCSNFEDILNLKLFENLFNKNDDLNTKVNKVNFALNSNSEFLHKTIELIALKMLQFFEESNSELFLPPLKTDWSACALAYYCNKSWHIHEIIKDNVDLCIGELKVCEANWCKREHPVYVTDLPLYKDTYQLLIQLLNHHSLKKATILTLDDQDQVLIDDLLHKLTVLEINDEFE